MRWLLVIEYVVALLVTTNPFSNIPVFIGITAQFTPERRKRIAALVAVTTGVTLVGAVFCGQSLLKLFGINIPCFQVIGGILLLLTAISMMREKSSGSVDGAPLTESDQDSIGVVPLGIPLHAGPGAICTAIIFSNQATSGKQTFVLTGACVFAALCIWGVLRMSHGISRILGSIGTNVLVRLMGLLLGAVAVKFVTVGIGSLLPGLVAK